VVTIADVARLAGVSKTTVSHAISGKRPVAPATRERITQIIAELGFRPNALARSLRMQRTQTIALIIPDITDPYYPALARGLQDTLASYGYYAILCNTDGEWHQEHEFIVNAIQRQVDGIILSSSYTSHENVRQLVEHSVAFVSIGPNTCHPDTDHITTDDQTGAMNATRYLLQQGHQRIGFIGGSPKQPHASARLAGYCKALEEAHIPIDEALIVEGDFKRTGGQQAFCTLIQQFDAKTRPTAVFCANDLMAIGALDVARQLGMKIPYDMAIIGYDDITAASLVTPALTTIQPHTYDAGKVAGQLLMERITGIYEGPGRQVAMPHQLIQRESA